MMQLAYYDLGDIEDPLGILHDAQGFPVLRSNERLIAKQEGNYCQVVRTVHPNTWDITGGRILMYSAGRGVLYRTNLRLIYIRAPQPKKYIEAIGNEALAMSFSRKARKWLVRRRMECFSIDLREIYGFQPMHALVQILVWNKIRHVVGFRPLNMDIFQGLMRIDFLL